MVSSLYQYVYFYIMCNMIIQKISELLKQLSLSSNLKSDLCDRNFKKITVPTFFLYLFLSFINYLDQRISRTITFIFSKFVNESLSLLLKVENPQQNLTFLITLTFQNEESLLLEYHLDVFPGHNNLEDQIYFAAICLFLKSFYLKHFHQTYNIQLLCS